MSKIFQCTDYEVQCHLTEYHLFDAICESELKGSLTAHRILNESFSVPLRLDEIERDERGGFPGLNAYLKAFSGKVGIYHLWEDCEHCTDHDTHLLLGVYVGKGYPSKRVRSHIKKKWQDKKVPMYVSFFECENRIAKYLEQLFLDTYKFSLNTAESKGSVRLFARWDDERYMLGSDLHDVANAYTAENLLDLLSDDDESLDAIE